MARTRNRSLVNVKLHDATAPASKRQPRPGPSDQGKTTLDLYEGPVRHPSTGKFTKPASQGS